VERREGGRCFVRSGGCYAVYLSNDVHSQTWRWWMSRLWLVRTVLIEDRGGWKEGRGG